MKERPIIFGGESVRALLAGTKTQTRRVIKTQTEGVMQCAYVPGCWSQAHGEDHEGTGPRCLCEPLKPFYGDVGERLWVRETWWLRGGFTTDFEGETSFISGEKVPENVRFAADYPDGGWPKSEYMYDGWSRRQAMFLPRRLARLTLAITNVRVERLQDISHADVLAEGVPAIDDFIDHWDCLNAMRGFPWSSNPYVWVLDVERAA